MKRGSVRNSQAIFQLYHTQNQQLTNTKRAVAYLEYPNLMLPVKQLGFEQYYSACIREFLFNPGLKPPQEQTSADIYG